MSSYNFTNQENRIFEVVPDGDYILEVIKCEFKVSARSGDDTMEIKVQAEGTDAQFFETFTFTEKAAWKIDTFVKSCNLLINGKPPVLNQPIDFTENMVVGLRGWAAVKKEPKQNKAGVVVPNEFRNVVRVWITSKEKLAKRVVETEPAESDPDWGA